MLEEYANNNGISANYDGLGFFQGFSKLSEVSFEDFIKEFLNINIINRHQLVAYRKMGGGSQSTQKFIIEDGLIRHIGNYGAVFTGPRVGNLITFLKDMRLITSNGVITEEGKDVLTSIAN